jgi:membrane protease YdiL (CAAX protease family)
MAHDDIRDEYDPPQSADPAPDSALGSSESFPSPSERPAWTAPYVPADLSVPWSWADLLVLIFAAAVGTVLIELLVVAALPLFGISRAILRESSGESTVVEIAMQVLLDLALLGYLAVQIRVWYRLPFWRTIGWRRLETEKFPSAIAYLGCAFGGFVLVAIVSLASSAFPPSRTLPIETVFQYRSAVLMYMLTAVFVAPLVEETLFRGYLYPVIARAMGIGAGVIITGALFGMLHAFQLWGGWWQIGLLIFVGIVLTAVRAATRTVAASYIVHLVYNSVQVAAFLFATHGGRNIP